MNNTGKQFGIFLLGAMTGATLGILLAPDKGSKTRRKIIDTTAEVGHKIHDEVDEIKKGYNKKVDENLDHVKEGVDSVKKALTMN